MAKKLYLGEGNNSNKVNKLYIGEQNTANKVVKAYIGVDNKSKQFWPSQIIYLWDKYTIGYTYQTQNVGSSYVFETRSISYNSWPFYWGRFFPAINPNGYFVLDGFTRNSIDYDNDSGRWSAWRTEHKGYTGVYYGQYTQTKEIIHCSGYSDVNGNYTKLEVFSNSSSLTKYTTVPIKGNYVGEITSTNPNAYPKNGISGNYWYVYKGQQ